MVSNVQTTLITLCSIWSLLMSQASRIQPPPVPFSSWANTTQIFHYRDLPESQLDVWTTPNGQKSSYETIERLGSRRKRHNVAWQTLTQVATSHISGSVSQSGHVKSLWLVSGGFHGGGSCIPSGAMVLWFFEILFGLVNQAWKIGFISLQSLAYWYDMLQSRASDCLVVLGCLRQRREAFPRNPPPGTSVHLKTQRWLKLCRRLCSWTTLISQESNEKWEMIKMQLQHCMCSPRRFESRQPQGA